MVNQDSFQIPRLHVVGSIGRKATFLIGSPQTGGDPDNFFTEMFFAEYNQTGICISAGTFVVEDRGSVFGTDIAVTAAGQEYIGSFGLLYGYPAGVGTFSFTTRATDSNGCSESRSYTVTISNSQRR